MCLICEANNGKNNENIVKRNIVVHFRQMVQDISTTPSVNWLRPLFISCLREAALQIEENMNGDKYFQDVLTLTNTPLESKIKRVEEMMVSKESQFYTDYRMVMPQEVRDTLKAEMWDSLERENDYFE